MCFVFVFRIINFFCLHRQMHSTCVWNMTKQSKYPQTRYDMTHIYDTYISVKNACLNYREFDLEGDLVTPFMVLIGPVFYNTIKACLKRVGNGGYG